MANSLRNQDQTKTPVTGTTEGGAKKYLDFAGLNALWDNICDKFSPQWKTVNFDFITKSEPTHEENTVILPFQNISMGPTDDGVNDHSHVLQSTYTILPAGKWSENHPDPNLAGEYHAGVMSAEDKEKLDNLSASTEDAITYKGSMFGGTKADNVLTVFNTNDTSDPRYKKTAIDFIYNQKADALQIVDLFQNDPTKRVKASINITDILNGTLDEQIKGVLSDAFISSIEIVNEGIVNGVQVSGIFLKITYVIDRRNEVVYETDADGNVVIDPETGGPKAKTDADGNIIYNLVEATKEAYCNVADLIETYTEGDGIKIEQTSTDVNYDATSTTISVIAPVVNGANNKIGGIIPEKIYTKTDVNGWTAQKDNSTTNPVTLQALGTQSNRYFGIETDKSGHAFVNAPSATIVKGTTTELTDTVNNNNSNDTFKVVTDVSMSLSEDGSTYTYVPTYTTFTVDAAEELSIALNGVEATKNAGKAKITMPAETPEDNQNNKKGFNGGNPDADDGCEITYIKEIEVGNDHRINVVTDTYTLKETGLTITDVEAPETDPNIITITPGTESSVTVLETITVGDHHEIVRDSVKVKVADPAAIDIDYIEGLTWAIPISKLHFRNESTYETDADHKPGATPPTSN